MDKSINIHKLCVLTPVAASQLWCALWNAQNHYRDYSALIVIQKSFFYQRFMQIFTEINFSHAAIVKAMSKIGLVQQTKKKNYKNHCHVDSKTSSKAKYKSLEKYSFFCKCW